MSLYWQQALSNRDQNSAQDQPAQSQWDYVNLGGAPSVPYQWGQYNESSNGSTAQTDPYAAAAYSGFQYNNGGQQQYTNQSAPQYSQNNIYSNNYVPQQDQGNIAQESSSQVQHAPILSNTLITNPKEHGRPYSYHPPQLDVIEEQQETQHLDATHYQASPQYFDSNSSVYQSSNYNGTQPAQVYLDSALNEASCSTVSPVLNQAQAFGQHQASPYVQNFASPCETVHASSSSAPYQVTDSSSVSPSCVQHVSLPDTSILPENSMGCVPLLECNDATTEVLMQDQESSSDGQQSLVVTEDVVNLENSCNSSQVTPESTYSVDTFASKEECGNMNGAKDDDWDDWEQTDRSDTLHEASPSAASITQSEPVCQSGTNLYTDNSRESSLAPGSCNNWSRESSVPPLVNGAFVKQEEIDRSSETQPAVAQVAPLVKKASVEPVDQPIARVEPVAQASDSPSNVQRVAPTRPIASQTTIQANQTESVRSTPSAIVESTPRQPSTPAVEPLLRSNLTPETAPRVISTVESAFAPVPAMESIAAISETDTPTLSSVSSSTATVIASVPVIEQPPIVELTEAEQVVETQEDIPEIVNQQRTDANTRELCPPQQDDNAITPEPANPLDNDSPGEAQATSTPLSEHDINRSNARRGSSSSVRGVPQSQTMPQLSGDQSDSTQSSFTRAGVRGSYHERYRGVKEKYLGSVHNVPQVIQRLDRYRVETPRMKKNPLVDMSLSGRRSALTVGANNGNTSSAQQDTSIDNNISFKNEMDKGNSSMYSQQDNSLDQSVDISRGNIGYGDDFVNAARRSRLSRNRPASRAKSEIGESAPHPNAHPQTRQGGYDYNRPVHPSYYQGYHPMHPGRRSAVPYGADFYQPRMYYDYPRPQSTVDARAMQRFQQEGGNYSTYDAYAYPAQEEEGSYESDSMDEEEETGESEDEMRQYNATASMSSYSMQGVPPRHPMEYHRWHPKLTFYLGMLRLDTKLVEQVFRRLQPPMEFYTILTQPHEQAAYLYYASVYKKLFANVRDFQNKFNKEFYKYKCEGLNDNDALCRICKSMYDEYNIKRLTSQQKAYEASQRQLFSDDRDSADGVSDRASIDDKDDDRQSDILSIDSVARAPLKFRTPHAFVTFGPGGKMITVQPDVSVSTVLIDDVKKVMKDNESKRLIEAAQIFRGPLVEGKTPSHSVLLYIERQISKIKMSDVAAENPHDNDVVDCLLVWQLLEMLVQQQGRVTGPDIARLLIAAGSSTSRASAQRDKSVTPVSSGSSASNSNGWASAGDPQGFERFSQFLLRGHVEEAIECALQDGLYADAMALARRLFPGDRRKLVNIESRFLNTRPATNPVMTLMAVSSGEPAPILTNPPVDDTGSWRTHAAIVLANLDTDHARQTVYGLGLVLAKREYHAAADFCLLAVALLSNFDVFTPVPNSEGDTRTHISLIHASLPDDDWESTYCRYGFSLTDLHATEIFDYALKLAQRASPLQKSLDFQRKRLQYAQLLAGFGGFTTDSFRYCLSVASSVWEYYYLLSASELIDLADLADRLRFAASAEPQETAWIDSLREMIVHLPQSSGVQSEQQENSHTMTNYDNSSTTQSNAFSNHQQEANNIANQETYPPQTEQHASKGQESETIPSSFAPTTQNISSSSRARVASTSSTRSRAESLVLEANDWHNQRQDPIQITPKMAPPQQHLQTTPASNDNSLQEYTTPRDRSDSLGMNPMYGEQLCSAQQKSYQSYDQYSSSQYDNDSSEQTTTPETMTHESTPVRQPHTNEYMNNYTPQMQVQSVYDTYEQPSVAPPSAPAFTAPPPDAVPAKTQAANQPVRNQLPQDKLGPAGAPGADQKKQGGGRGFIGKLLSKVIPEPNSMILPDDKNPSIHWDPKLGKWVGAGVEEETAPAPPPAAAAAIPGASLPFQGGGLRAARGSGGSRYFNPLVASGNASAPDVPVAAAPPSMPIPTSFGFIPTMPDDVDSVDPFSGEANPTVHGVDSTPDTAN